MSEFLSQDESACTRCELSVTRTQVVIGRGSTHAEVMFLGEAPGRNEDLQGRGFIGVAGQRFDRILAFLGLQRDDIWLCNAVRCRPSIAGKRNRPPKPLEIAACRHWLKSDLDRVRPRLVVTLGRVAFESVTGLDWRAERRATLHEVQEFKIPVFALYHPAYLIYRRDLVDTYRQDLEALRVAMNILGISFGNISRDEAAL